MNVPPVAPGRRCCPLAVAVEKARSLRRPDGAQRWRGRGAGIEAGCRPRRDCQAAAGAGQEDPGERNPGGDGGVRRRKICMVRLAFVAQGRPMRTLCRALGRARSHAHERHHRSENWRDGRKERRPEREARLLAEIKAQITQLPTHGCRCSCALVNRQRVNTAAATPIQSQARGRRGYGTQRSALALRRAADQVRLGTDADKHVRQRRL
mgnify:CR=1 FL=1|jgi:hypothetical protein